MQELAKLSREQVKDLMLKPPRLHRFDKMSDLFYLGIQRIANQYSGDAARIWKGSPSSADVVYRFLEFEGVGPKIATMAANLLARIFNIPFADYFSIDISADVHVRRVFGRLGLCPFDATIEQVIYKAKGIASAISWHS
jgi:endonuclease-3